MLGELDSHVSFGPTNWIRDVSESVQIPRPRDVYVILRFKGDICEVHEGRAALSPDYPEFSTLTHGLFISLLAGGKENETSLF